MGQRHQLFVIARINGRYRQLAAIHHQWLFGHTALRRCRDMLNIFSNTTNRIPLQQELIAASRKDHDFWLESYDDKNEHVPFPFIMTCLVTGASFNVDGYYHGVLIEPFFMPHNGGDNDDGITIFDITEPGDVHYCFVDFKGMGSEREVDLNTPLSARTYLEAYYILHNCDGAHKDDEASNDDVADMLALVQSFEGKPLITLAALAETWPAGDWGTDIDVLESESTTVSGFSVLDTAEKPKSLRHQSLDRVLDLLLGSSDEKDVQDLMTEAVHLYDFIATLRQRMYSQAPVLQASAANVYLLREALEGETIVHFNEFKHWNAESLAKVVKGIESVKALNLSNMPDFTESELEIILNSAPSVEALVILEMPQISIEFVANHLGSYDVYHSELFRAALYKPYLRTEP
ncbi:MAG: hypothetical protein Q9174_006089 [Haloplaca sp. 1 TL-2023]